MTTKYAVFASSRNEARCRLIDVAY